MGQMLQTAMRTHDLQQILPLGWSPTARLTGALAVLAGQDYSLCDHRQGVFEVIGA